MKGETQLYPMLLIGKAAVEFKQSNKNIQVRKVTSIEDVRELVSYYSVVEDYENILGIEDIAFLDSRAQVVLLKFIEETRLRVVLLASYDSIVDTLLSRMVEVKKDIKDEYKVEVYSIEKAIEDVLMMEEEHKIEKVRYYARHCPILYLYDSKVGYDDRIKRSVFNVLHSLGG